MGYDRKERADLRCLIHGARFVTFPVVVKRNQPTRGCPVCVEMIRDVCRRERQRYHHRKASIMNPRRLFDGLR